MKEQSSHFAQLPTLVACFFGTYVGGSFIYPSAKYLLQGEAQSIAEVEIGWVLLGLLFILLSIVHLIKFTDLGNNEAQTQLMFTAEKDSPGITLAYAIIFFLLAALGIFFFTIHWEQKIPMPLMEQLALGLIIGVNLVMGIIKLSERRKIVTRKPFRPVFF